MYNLEGKKLLILGATANEISIVKKAQTYGIYVIVTDYHTDYNLSPAKFIADEAWDISWSELDTLEKKCRENNVDGVIAGYSEIRVEQMILLCERLGLPSYISLHQLEITRDKRLFKDECRKNDIPVINEYKSIDDVTHFPVIVKPVDRAGSIGITIANDYEQLVKSYNYAMEMSICKKVIIEDFIQNENKADFYYAIVDGEITLLTSSDVIFAAQNGTDRVVQSAWPFPSTHHEAFVKTVDQKIQNMIKNMNIKNGYMFFSSFVDDNDNFKFFECGFRLSGEHIHEYTDMLGLYNNLDIFILYALNGNLKMLKKPSLITENKNLKCITINFYAKSGIITKISKIDKIKELSDCKIGIIQSHLGQKCDEDHAILSKIGMFYFCNSSSAELKKDVDFLYSNFEAKDENGNDMIYDYVDSNLIENWWD